jgi:beta-glucanase (GH16 family)
MTNTKLLLLAVPLLFIGTGLHAASDKIDQACWTQTFSDEFDSLDLWDPQTNTGQWRTRYIWDRNVIINNELQYYIDPKEHGLSPFDIDDGILSITANKTPMALRDAVQNQPYISGVLTSENGFAQQYGRFDVRARPPKGKGLWSAFWLLPSFDQWPAGVAVLPEIDVMEHIGHEPNTFHTTLHTNQNGKLESHPYDHTLNVDLTQDFHIYSVVWEKQSVNWYIDYKRVASHPTPTDFTRPVHFLLNLAVGGDWPGAPDNRTRFPASFQIDYVRAFQPKAACH